MRRESSRELPSNPGLALGYRISPKTQAAFGFMPPEPARSIGQDAGGAPVMDQSEQHCLMVTVDDHSEGPKGFVQQLTSKVKLMTAAPSA